MGPIVQDPKLGKLEKAKEVDEMNVDYAMTVGSIATNSASRSCSDLKHGGNSVGQPSVIVPEGRVHGGSLMALLAGGSDANTNIMGTDSAVPMKSYMMSQNWM